MEAGGRLGAGVQDVAALLPAGADATEVTVWIEGWGFRFARRRFPLRAREDEGLDEIRVALEPVEASAWSAVRVVLAGEGETGESDSVAESESIRLAISPPSTAYGPPRLVVEFEPGSPRARDVRVPFAASAVEIKALPRESVEDGRRVWTGPPRVRVDRAPEEGGAAATFAVVRLPAAVLELDLRYAGVERPEAIDWWGSWSVVTTDPRDGTRRGYVTTFYVRVGGGPDVVRVEREGGRLKALSGIAAGFTVAVDPPGPHDLRLSETTRAAATVEAKSAQPPR